MAGVFKLKITETTSELKTLLGQQKTAFGKERVQALYLLKLRKVKTIQELALHLGRNRTTWRAMVASVSSGRRKRTARAASEVRSKTGNSKVGYTSLK